MPDLGHDLRFGTFLTPQTRRPDDVVALAQLSERRAWTSSRSRTTPTSPRSSTRGR